MPPHNFFATLLLLLSTYAASAASIIDKPTSNLLDKPTSNLINHLDPITTTQAVQALRDETLSKNVQENVQRRLDVQRRLAKVSASSSAAAAVTSYSSTTSSSHESHSELKPDSTKSAKNDSKCAKNSNSIENTYFAEMEMCKAEKADLEDTKAKLADTEAKLAALQEEMAKPHWLFVQVGDKCVLDLSGDTPTIESADFDERDTEMFTDRPLTFHNKTSTANWFKKFNELFNDGHGWPNTAMTFVHEDNSVGVVVTAFVNGYIKDGEGNQTIYGYNLKQSEEQKKTKSLEDIMGGKDKVEFDHCSFFIDSSKDEISNLSWDPLKI